MNKLERFIDEPPTWFLSVALVILFFMVAVDWEHALFERSTECTTDAECIAMHNAQPDE